VNKLDIAKILLKTGCVSIKPNEPFTYASGLRGPIYCDNRVMLGHVAERYQVCTSFVDVINKNSFVYDHIGGLATAGIPHAAWIAHEMKRSMVYIRSKPKGHGKGNQIEGNFKEGDKILIVEDLVNQAKSLEEAVLGARSDGAAIEDCLCIVDYEMPAALDRVKKLGLRLFSLTDFSHIIKAGVELGFINESDHETLNAWQKDPVAWDKNLI
tara:strand:+ start:17371 stop:18006 length:636 start_codon:yes stop_codon:yes gene_type:complete